MVSLASDILKTKTTAAELSYRHLEELRVLGDGGHGSVSLCRDEATGKLFALKTTFSQAGHGCLQNEFDAVKLLMESGVEGIVPIHDIDEDEEGQLCVLMDFCNKGSLISVLGKEPGGRLQEREAARVVRSLARTLRECHSIGIMHRDIKLDNVLVHCSGGGGGGGESKKRKRRTTTTTWWRSADEAAMATEEEELEKHHHRLDVSCCKFLLSDFGLACSFRPGHHIRGGGSLAGTPAYMAPELLKDVYDERADVWSLGVLLHLILTGAFPSQSSEMARLVDLKRDDDDDEEPNGLIRKKRLWKMDWSRPMYAHLSEGAKSVLGGMLEKKPRRRISLTQICEHPWVKQEESLIPVPAKKRIRLVYGRSTAENSNKNDAAAANIPAAPPQQPSCFSQQKPAAEAIPDSAGAPDGHDAPLLIRIKFRGVIIREFRAEHTEEQKKKKKKKNKLLLPVPPPALPAF